MEKTQTYIPKKADGTSRKKRIINPKILLGNFLQKIYQEKKKKQYIKKQKAVFEKFKMLFQLFKGIDNQLLNRHAKKVFWRDFIKDGRMQKNVFLNMINSANTDKKQFLIDRNDLQLDEGKLKGAINNINPKEGEMKIVIDIIKQIKISDIIK